MCYHRIIRHLHLHLLNHHSIVLQLELLEQKHLLKSHRQIQDLYMLQLELHQHHMHYMHLQNLHLEMLHSMHLQKLQQDHLHQDIVIQHHLLLALSKNHRHHLQHLVYKYL